MKKKFKVYLFKTIYRNWVYEVGMHICMWTHEKWDVEISPGYKIYPVLHVGEDRVMFCGRRVFLHFFLQYKVTPGSARSFPQTKTTAALNVFLKTNIKSEIPSNDPSVFNLISTKHL